MKLLFENWRGFLKDSKEDIPKGSITFIIANTPKGLKIARHRGDMSRGGFELEALLGYWISRGVSESLAQYYRDAFSNLEQKSIPEEVWYDVEYEPSTEKITLEPRGLPMIEETKLRVFDFDDTLVKSDSRIKVTSEDGTETYITPAEFAQEGEKPDNTYDYSEFETVVDPRELKKGTDVLKSVVDAGTDGREIVILTARAPESETAIKDYLESIGIDISKITFVLLGDADPKMKSSWIEKRIVDGASDVVFIDDSGKNVDAVRELEDKYPEVKFDIRKVSYAEEIDEGKKKKNDINKVAKVIIYDDDKVLIIKRNDKDAAWDLPGGHLEEGESTEEGATRETKEETNLDVKDLQYVSKVGRDTFYKCSRPKGDIKLQKEEHTDYKWIKPTDLGDYQMRDTLKKAIEKSNEAITEDFQQTVKKGYRKMKMRLISTGSNKYNVGGKMKKPPTARSKSAPAGFGGSLEENK